MDIIAIILTIAACIGGLIILYILGAIILFAFTIHQAKKFDAEEQARFNLRRQHSGLGRR